MNPAWKQYLLSLNASFSATDEIKFNTPSNQSQPQGFITPITHLAVLRVSGIDATLFLQGQTTCNLNELNAGAASFGAFCNAKGRVTSTFIILKHEQDWLLILPTELLPTLQKRLHLYILRAKVQLSDERTTFCLLGLDHITTVPTFGLPQHHLSVGLKPDIIVRLGDQSPRYLILADQQSAPPIWADLLQQGYCPQNTAQWQLLDIQAGFPWLCAETTEAYIPQMLNLDQLGGISFNKGCYTGQEVVARTHYLGKAKRILYTATVASIDAQPALNSNILDAQNGQIVGTILATSMSNNNCTLLVILATEAAEMTTLTLQDHAHTQLKLTSRPTHDSH